MTLFFWIFSLRIEKKKKTNKIEFLQVNLQTRLQTWLVLWLKITIVFWLLFDSLQSLLSRYKVAWRGNFAYSKPKKCKL